MLRTLGLALFSLAFLPLSSGAQSSAGTLTGEVHDSKGANVQGADVTVTNLETRVARHAQTSSAGLYRIAELEPGTYTLEVRKPGFASQQVAGLLVETASVATANVDLRVGSVDTVVSVNADVQLLSPDSATLTSTVDSQLANDVPLPERSALQLALLTAGAIGDPQYNGGVQSENPGAFTQASTPGGSISLSGGRLGSTAQLIDGLDVTLSSYPRAGVTFSGQDIAQITVQQNGLAAQYGRTGGGIINQSTKGGSARFHGYLQWRHLDPFLEAYTYGSTTAPARHQNLFTLDFGGPVPTGTSRLGKTFVFGSWEPLRASDDVYVRLRAITPDESAGRLNTSQDLLNQTILHNQGYAAALAAPHVGDIYNQFAPDKNNPLFPSPTGRLSSKSYTKVLNNDLSAQVAANPFARGIYGLLPNASTRYLIFDNPDFSPRQDGNNAVGARGVLNRDDRYNVRVDQRINDANNFFVRYTNVPVIGVRFNYVGPENPLGNIPTDSQVSKNAVFSYTHIFRGSMVDNLRASYIRSNRLRSPAPASLTQDYAASFGLQPAIDGVGFPQVSLTERGPTALIGLGAGGAITDGGTTIDASLSVGNDFQFVRGHHAIQLGVDYRALQNNRADNSYQFGGQYQFTPTTTTNGSVGGSPLAALDLGLVNAYIVAAPQRYYYRDKYFAAYVQDDWRVLRNLTLNLGLRYNLEPPRREKFGQQGSFLPGVANLQPLLVPVVAGTTSAATNGAFVFSGSGGLSETLWPTFYKGFEPRLGIAYQPAHSMTVRAAYSLVHLPLTGLGNAPVPSIGNANQSLGPADSTGAYVDLITNKPAVTATPAPRTGPLYQFSAAGALPSIDQSKAVPYAQLWSLSVQFSVGKSTLIEATYAAQKGTHLFTLPVSLNVPTLATSVADAVTPGDYITAKYQNVYDKTLETGLQAQEPYQQFYTNPINTAYDRGGSSNYNAFYLTGRHQATRNLNVFTSFTWSKSLDNSSTGSTTTVPTDVYGFIAPQLPYSNAGEYSLSEFDTPVRVAGGYTYTLPFGGSGALRSGSRLVNAVIGGFTTSGVFSMQSGFPFGVLLGNTGAFNATLPGSAVFGSGGPTLLNASLRPNRVPGVPVINKDWKKDPFGINGGHYINPAAFAQPGTPGNPQIGNAPRTLGDGRNPRTIYFDASIRKSIPLSIDRASLTLKLDAINVLNHSNFFLGNTTATRNLNGALLPAATAGNYANDFNGNAGFGLLSQGANIPGRAIALGVILEF